MTENLAPQPVHTEPAYKIAARTMREKILSGEIEVGEVLPSEMAMADLLRINRSTVREAIRLLEENGIVSRKPGGKKLFVSVPKRADLSSRMTTAMVLQRIKIDELWGAMLVLEPAIAANAARNVSDAQIAQLDKNLAETVANVDDKQSILELDLEFHQLLSEACGNRALQLCREPVSALFYPAFNAVFQRLNAGERLLTAHRSILEALKGGDAKVAEEWMRKHIVDFRRGYELANLDIERPVGRLPSEGPSDE